MKTQYNYLAAWLKAHAKTDRGASLVEYALLVALIAVVAIFAVSTLGGKVKSTFSDVNDQLDTPSEITP
ncbi:MAG: Flp family type IVb pilin [Acidimicrobiia bacterium]